MCELTLCTFQKVQWKNWMTGIPEFHISPETKYSDIIVPTIDTVRSAKVLEMLVTNKKTVSFSDACFKFILS